MGYAVKPSGSYRAVTPSMDLADDERYYESLPAPTQEQIASEKWAEVRVRRDRLMSACDWTQLPDAALTAQQKLDWADYRQALRDIPQDFGNPDDVIFPEAPNG
jgi:hypothetical protein